MPEILSELYQAIQETVVGKLRHPNYKRTVDLARKYKQLITGEDFESLLHQFVRREDLTMFKQRVNITQPITPAIIAAIMNPFYKVGRTNNITKRIDFKDGSDKSNKLTKLSDAIEGFWGDKSLDKYLETRFTELSFSDPNSFIVTEFDQKPNELGVMELPKPRAFEVSSENAINFRFVNNTLEWLIVELPIEINEKGTKFCGSVYTIYGPEYSIKFTQISIEGYGELPINKITEYSTILGTVKIYRANDKEVYVVEEFNHKSKIIPAIRVGYKSDLYTDGATCVAPFHDGMAYLMKSIKTVSEFDLSMALHAYPQKFAYGPACYGESKEIGCNNGASPDGSTCKKCQGSGVAIHTSTQDAIILRMPRSDVDMIDLSKLVYYASPPIDLAKFQNEYILQITEQVKSAVFNSEIFSKTEVTATATEKQINMESVYDTLFPFAEKESDVYKQVTRTSGYYLDIFDLVVIHQFPKDFKFKTVFDLLTELKLANDSNAPGYVRKELSNDIAEAQFIDKPEELRKIRVRSKFYPFSDKTDAEILYIISNGKTSEHNIILWANFDNIFTEIDEDEQMSNSFYMMAYPKQKEIIAGKVTELITSISLEAPPASVPFGQTEPVE